MKRLAVAIATASLVVSGCASTLSVRRVDPGQPADGYPYQLRYTQFETTVVWQVIKCDPSKDEPLTVKIAVTPKTSNPLDPDHLYAIDPRSLQGLFRTTGFSMEWYEDRGPKSINSAVDDQTGPAIVSALTGVARLAGLELGAPGSGGAPVSTDNPCAKEVDEALKKVHGDPTGVLPRVGLAARTAAAEAEVTRQTVIVARLSAQMAAAGAAVDDQTRSRFNTETNSLAALVVALDLEKAALKEALRPLTDTTTVRWPVDGRTLSLDSLRIRPSLEARTRWRARDLPAADVYFALRPLDGYSMPDYAAAPTAPRPAAAPSSPLAVNARPIAAVTQGLPYREPRPMRLYACQGAACTLTPEDPNNGSKVLHAADVQVFQAGGLFSLPFSATTFANITNAAGFSQSGVLTSAGSAQVRGAGTTLASTFADGSTQIAAAVQADRTADTARIKAETDEILARRALEDARRGPTPDQQMIAAYEIEVSLATAEIAALEARRALDAARAQQESQS